MVKVAVGAAAADAAARQPDDYVKIKAAPTARVLGPAQLRSRSARLVLISGHAVADGEYRSLYPT